ncbi:MAG: hypothetical protein LUF33_08045, partial [Clostridiales bacterium]|nr:hypothetical protein [Clostridiales bacterium]
MIINGLKKLCAVMMCAVIAAAGTLVCSAATNRYQISELDDMIITLPDDMTAVTRSSKDTDKYFSVFGLNYDTTMENFKSSDIYLQGMDNSSALTVTVTMTKTTESSGIKNYNLLEDGELTEVKNNFLNQNEYIACTPDETGKLVWLYFDVNVTNDGRLIGAYQSNTVYDGMSVNITLQRNEGDVTAEDYETFKEIVSSVSFLKESAVSPLTIYIIICACAVALIVLVLIIIFAKRSKKRSKVSKNNEILKELADKYNLDDNSSDKLDLDISYEDTAAEPDADISTRLQGYEDESAYSDIPEIQPSKPKYTEEEVNAVLEDISGASEDEGISVKIYQRESGKTEAEEPSRTEDTHRIENLSDIDSDDESLESPEEEEIEEKSDYADNIFGKAVKEDSDEFNNDEELVRQEAKKTKFNDSDDFFEEAPKRTVGVISNKEIEDAEDYDVINEVEKRVSQVEREDVDEGAPIGETLGKIGNGIKSFAVHFGYFCQNLHRMMKRRKAAKKRRKQKEERRERERQRRERARLRAERERQQRREMQDGGLVKVHSKNERRTPQNRRPNGTASQRRPQQGKRPGSS